MAKNNLGGQVASGFFWQFGERILAQLVSFIVSTVIARLVSPENYGTIAIVNIFITFANVFVTGGFGNALIQKKDADEIDFSSIFFSNIFVSVIIYIILFCLAPVMSLWYGMDELKLIIRIMGIRIIVASINSVQHAYVSRHMQFKRFFWSTLIGTVVSGIVGIALAYKGFGVWALVAQYLINTTMDTIVLFITVKWRPKLVYSFKRVKGLLAYGWKLLVSDLINTGYVEVRSLIIGLKYNSSDLAFYNKGQSFPKLVISNIDVALKNVLFPVMSKNQDEKQVLKSIASKSIRINCFIILPLVTGLALVAEPFIRLLLTEKWIGCVPFLQLYCIFYGLIPLQSANLQIIKAVGRTDIYLKQEIIKKIVGIGLLIISIPFGPMMIAVSAIASNLFAIMLTMLPSKKLIDYSFAEQIKDLLSSFIPLACMGIIVSLVRLLEVNDVIMLCMQICVGILTYVLVAVITKNESLKYVLTIIKRFKKKVRVLN